jgi:hypothetical protein
MDMAGSTGPSIQCTRLPQTFIFGGVLLTLAAAVAGLAEPRGLRHFLTVFLGAVTFFLTLIGLGAVFGKVLGDFLRGVN